MSKLSFDDLFTPFVEASEGPSRQLLGAESEKFGILEESFKPVSYDGRTCGIVNLFDQLCQLRGYIAVPEYPGGPVIAIEKGDGLAKQSITLEPGAQLELSGAALDTVHQVEAELAAHLAELAPASAECGMRWLSLGYHPLAKQEALPWVPKQRYRIMREYFPSVGTRGVDMMRRTCTVQVNLDYHNEEHAMRMLRVALKLAPILTAMFASSPFAEGRITGNKSERALVWLDTDRHRTGLLPALQKPGMRWSDYIDWALGVPMYMFKRDGEAIVNTGQPFRSFLEDGFEGHHATLKDWETHLATLFPEARLKRTLELRSVDAQSRTHYSALPALCAGVFYDDTALAEVEALVGDLEHEALEAARPAIAQRALAAEIGGRSVQSLALSVLTSARGGLSRRNRLDATGRDECHYLDGITALCERGQSPADEMLAKIDSAASDLRAQIVAATAMPLS